jgi:hypothetical protein
MTTIAFMGSEMDAFLPSDSSPMESSLGGQNYDPAFTRCYIELFGNSYVDTPQFAALTECWTHLNLWSNISSSGTVTTYPMEWLDGGDVPVLRLNHTSGSGSETIVLEHYASGTWSAIGTPISSVPLETTGLISYQVMDFRFIVNSVSGKAEIYAGSSLRSTQTVDLSAITSIRKVRVLGGFAGGFPFRTRFSQMIVQDTTTIGFRLGTCVPTGAGSTSSWTGTYASIDETVYADGDFISSGTAAQVSTFAQTPIPSLTGYVVRAVGVSARAKRGAAGPQNIRLTLRSAGTNYFSGSDIAVGFGYAPVQTIWATDPATSAAWVNTAVATLEPGVKSIT